jgi:anaerobic selenocysteine-containing dehydrogenase
MTDDERAPIINEAPAPFADDLRRASWEDILSVSDLPRDQLERVANIYMRARAVIARYGMGITQHRLGAANVQQTVNLLLLRGNIGKPGAGICPVRGYSNVQGDRTMASTKTQSRNYSIR